MTQRAKVETKNTNYPNKSSQELEQEIGHTREAISEDIRALGEKVSPENLKAEASAALGDAKDAAVDKAVEVKDAAVEKIAAATSVAVDKAVEVKDVVVDKALELKDAAAEKVEEYRDLAAETYDEVSYQTRRATRATWSYTKENAVPLALIGVGAGLLFANSRRGREPRPNAPALRRPYRTESPAERLEPDYSARSSRPAAVRPREYILPEPGPNLEYDDAPIDYESRSYSDPRSERGTATRRASNKIARAGRLVGERARSFSENAGEGLHDVEDRIADTAARSRDYAKEKLARARDATRDFAAENPLPLALATVALGVGVGMLLPSTSRENALLGPTRDKLGRVIDDARDAAYEVAEVAKETAKDAVQAVT